MNTDALKVVQDYFDAWNRRDPEAIVATLPDGATYSDSIVSNLSGAAFAGYARGLFESFPDLLFEVVGAAMIDGGRVAAQWVMKGTNTGPMQGNPPTGRKLAIPGADFFVVEGDRIRSVQGYFDQKAFLEQLGLQVLAVPQNIGPISFGVGLQLNLENKTKPGAFSITWIESAGDADTLEVRQLTQAVVMEMSQMKGFISWLATTISGRGCTVSAWTDPESPAQLLKSPVHRNAIERVFSGNLARAVHTSVWVPERINAVWVRCAACGKVVDHERSGGQCACGAKLPERPRYW